MGSGNTIKMLPTIPHVFEVCGKPRPDLAGDKTVVLGVQAVSIRSTTSSTTLSSSPSSSTLPGSIERNGRAALLSVLCKVQTKRGLYTFCRLKERPACQVTAKIFSCWHARAIS